jgi:hypothetical protein
LKESCQQHHRKASRCQREHASGGEDREPGKGRRLAADGVRERAVEQLSETESEEQQRDDELIVVRTLHAERRANRRKRRQDHVDRQRGERGQRRHQRNELTQTARSMRSHLKWKKWKKWKSGKVRP